MKINECNARGHRGLLVENLTSPHSFIHSFRRVASSSLMGAGVCVAASKPPQRAQPCSKFTSPSKPNRNDTLPEGRLSVCIGVARAILGTMCCLLWVPASTRTRFRFALKAQKLRNTGGGLGAPPPSTHLASQHSSSQPTRSQESLPACLSAICITWSVSGHTCPK